MHYHVVRPSRGGTGRPELRHYCERHVPRREDLPANEEIVQAPPECPVQCQTCATQENNPPARAQ